MKTQALECPTALSASELAQIDFSRYAHPSQSLFLFLIVQRGDFWHTALLQLDGKQLVASSVNPQKFTLEEAARASSTQERYRLKQLFKLVLPDLDR